MMQIAENLVRNGVTGGKVFTDKLTEFVREHQFTKLIETGTHKGTGTTRAILNGLDGEFTFISIEVNPDFFEIAVKNLDGIHGLHLINGLTVGKNDRPEKIAFNDVPDHIVVDHQAINREELYRAEVAFDVEDHQLDRALAAFEYQPEFVLLDAAGHMGFIEFKYLIDRVKSSFYLALDDTDHVKQYQVMEFIKAMPDMFEIIWQVQGENIDKVNGAKFGSAIIKVTV